MKRILAILLWLGLLAPLPAAEPTPTVAQIGVFQGIELSGHETEWEPAKYEWRVLAPDRSWVPVVAEEGGSRVRFADGDLSPGRYQVVLSISGPTGQLSTAVGDFTVGVGPGPGPDPKPDPKPDPQPDPDPQPADYLTVLVVHELAEMTAERPWMHIVHAPAVARWLADNRHQRIQVRDKDAVDETGDTPDDLAPWIKAALAEWTPGWPRVILLDGSTKLHHGPLPSTEAAFLELVRKHGRARGGSKEAAKADPPKPVELIVVGFEGCGPCDEMKPIIERLDKAGHPTRYADRVKEPEWQEATKATKYPTLLMLVNGKPWQIIVGKQKQSMLEKWHSDARKEWLRQKAEDN